MSRPPVIGITAYEEEAAWGPWTEQAVLLPAAYVQAVQGAGGLALVLPVQQDDALGRLLERVDALVVSGGPDVAAGRYGAEPHPAAQPPRAGRDEFELALLRLAGERSLPTLAVCRGVQVLNVARGGTLHQHLPDVVGHTRHSPVPGEFAWHPVDVEPGSRLEAMLGATTLSTASHHHQAVDALGTGLRVVARAQDGTVEALEDPEQPYLVGVQWHPEVGEDLSLFRALVDAAR